MLLVHITWAFSRLSHLTLIDDPRHLHLLALLILFATDVLIPGIVDVRAVKQRLVEGVGSLCIRCLLRRECGCGRLHEVQTRDEAGLVVGEGGGTVAHRAAVRSLLVGCVTLLLLRLYTPVGQCASSLAWEKVLVVLGWIKDFSWVLHTLFVG